MCDFSRALRFSLDMRHMDIPGLAKAIGVNQATVYRWANGEHVPAYGYVSKIATALSRDERLFTAAWEESMRKSLGKDVSISEMKELRAEGLTNKQIADRLDVTPQTVYRYIGKRSNDVHNAEQQNKACPVNGNVSGFSPAEKPQKVSEPVRKWAEKILSAKEPDTVAVVSVPVYAQKDDADKAFEKKEVSMVKEVASADILNSSMFKPLSTRIVTKLQGHSCVYSIDTATTYVELSDENGGQLAGIIDYESIPTVIAELQEILKMKGAC